MHEILWCYHSNETASTVLSRGESVDEILRCYHQMKPLAVLSRCSICISVFFKMKFVSFIEF